MKRDGNMDRFKEFTIDECVILRDGLYFFTSHLDKRESESLDTEREIDLAIAMMVELRDEISL